MPTTSGTSTRSERTAAANGAQADARLRTVAFADLTPRDLAEWRDLAARAAEPNPFFEPEALAPAADLYGSVDVGLIEAGGDLIGVLPLQRSRRWRHIPAATMAVWRHVDCFLGTPIVDAGAAERAMGALLDVAGVRLVAFDMLGTGGPVEAAIRAAATARGLTPIVYESHERAALQRRDEPTYLSGTVSKPRARELRRLRRLLCDHCGGDLAIHDRSGDPIAIEGYLRAEAAGWKGREGTHFASSDTYAEFFRDLCGRFASAGRLQLLVLSCGGQDIAWKVNLSTGDTVFCFKIAYDPAFARFSPGVQLELDFVDLFHDTAYAWSDSCADPNNEMINRLWPDRRSVATLLVPTPGPRGTAARHTVRAVMAARRQLRRTDEQAA